MYKQCIELFLPTMGICPLYHLNSSYIPRNMGLQWYSIPWLPWLQPFMIQDEICDCIQRSCGMIPEFQRPMSSGRQFNPWCSSWGCWFFLSPGLFFRGIEVFARSWPLLCVYILYIYIVYIYILYIYIYCIYIYVYIVYIYIVYIYCIYILYIYILYIYIYCIYILYTYIYILCIYINNYVAHIHRHIPPEHILYKYIFQTTKIENIHHFFK